MVFIYSISDCKSQQADSAYYKPGKVYYWGEGIIGIGYPGLYYGASASILINRYVYTIKASHNEEFNLFGPYPALIANEFSATLGKKVSHNKFGNYIFSAGLSINNLNTRGAPLIAPPSVNYGNEYVPLHAVNAGIPVEIRYINNIGLFGIGGFSTSVSANLNTKMSFYVFTFAVTLGHLRERGNENITDLKPWPPPLFPH